MGNQSQKPKRESGKEVSFTDYGVDETKHRTIPNSSHVKPHSAYPTYGWRTDDLSDVSKEPSTSSTAAHGRKNQNILSGRNEDKRYAVDKHQHYSHSAQTSNDTAKVKGSIFNRDSIPHTLSISEDVNTSLEVKETFSPTADKYITAKSIAIDEIDSLSDTKHLVSVSEGEFDVSLPAVAPNKTKQNTKTEPELGNQLENINIQSTQRDRTGQRRIDNQVITRKITTVNTSNIHSVTQNDIKTNIANGTPSVILDDDDSSSVDSDDNTSCNTFQSQQEHQLSTAMDVNIAELSRLAIENKPRYHNLKGKYPQVDQVVDHEISCPEIPIFASRKRNSMFSKVFDSSKSTNKNEPMRPFSIRSSSTLKSPVVPDKLMGFNNELQPKPHTTTSIIDEPAFTGTVSECDIAAEPNTGKSIHSDSYSAFKSQTDKPIGFDSGMSFTPNIDISKDIGGKIASIPITSTDRPKYTNGDFPPMPNTSKPRHIVSDYASMSSSAEPRNIDMNIASRLSTPKPRHIGISNTSVPKTDNPRDIDIDIASQQSTDKPKIIAITSRPSTSKPKDTVGDVASKPSTAKPRNIDIDIAFNPSSSKPIDVGRDFSSKPSIAASSNIDIASSSQPTTFKPRDSLKDIAVKTSTCKPSDTDIDIACQPSTEKPRNNGSDISSKQNVDKSRGFGSYKAFKANTVEVTNTDRDIEGKAFTDKTNNIDSDIILLNDDDGLLDKGNIFVTERQEISTREKKFRESVTRLNSESSASVVNSVTENTDLTTDRHKKLKQSLHRKSSHDKLVEAKSSNKEDNSQPSYRKCDDDKPFKQNDKPVSSGDIGHHHETMETGTKQHTPNNKQRRGSKGTPKRRDKEETLTTEQGQRHNCANNEQKLRNETLKTNVNECIQTRMHQVQSEKSTVPKQLTTKAHRSKTKIKTPIVNANTNDVIVIKDGRQNKNCAIDKNLPPNKQPTKQQDKLATNRRNRPNKWERTQIEKTGNDLSKKNFETRKKRRQQSSGLDWSNVCGEHKVNTCMCNVNLSIFSDTEIEQCKLEQFVQSYIFDIFLQSHTRKSGRYTLKQVSYSKSEHSVITLLEFQSKHAADDFIKSVATLKDKKVKANIQNLSETQINQLCKEYWRKMQERVQEPLRNHEKKMAKMDNMIAELRQSVQKISLDSFGEKMQELGVLETKAKELEQQQTEFLGLISKLQTQLQQLQYEKPRKIEAKLQDLRVRLAQEIIKLESALPMYSRKTDIINTVSSNKVSVIIGETGSGKSTQITQYLHNDGLAGLKQIVCTQPRKIAATSLAEQVSKEMGTHVGDFVGYKVDMREKCSKNTHILYMTDHCLLKECLKDPTLNNYGCIIVDEAHERSIYTDLLLGMLKNILIKRDDLKVIITSATIDPDVFVRFFWSETPVLRVSGRTFPVDVEYADKDVGERDDYVECAVQKAVDILDASDNGDILVFLTSPFETEKACEKLLARMRHRNNIQALPLHGKLQTEQYNQALRESDVGNRKVLFATNCAETSVTVPGIRYVIDTGLAKEKQFDVSRSVSTLKVQRITQSSCEQRKGRAGRVQAGHCYRLYTEETYKQLRSQSVPEILRMHLDQALLQLMALGVDDPLKFDFVESPIPEAMLNAVTSLQDIGAIEHGTITELGKKLAKLSLDPRLGKFVLDSVEHKIGYDGVVVAAIYSSGANVFFRGGSKEEKERSDRRKVLLCQEEGDLLTHLWVYKEWFKVEEKRKNKWCVDNAVNAKSMRIVRDTANEIMHVLRKELGISFHSDFSSNVEEKRQIPELLLECYPTKLAFFLGYSKAGYILPCCDMKRVLLHPSSAFRYLDVNPKWVLYETVLTTSDDFLINISSISETVVSKLVEKGKLLIDVAFLESYTIKAHHVHGIGTQLMRNIVGPQYSLLHDLEKHLSTITKSMVFLDTVPFAIVIQSREEHHSTIRGLIEEKIALERSKLMLECFEVSPNQGTGVSVVLGYGLHFQRFLSPNEYITLIIESGPPSWTKESATDYFEMFGTITQCKVYIKDKTLRGSVTFEKPEDAKSAHISSDGSSIKIRPLGKKRPQNSRVDMPVNLKAIWVRRPVKGNAFVNIRNQEDFVLCSSITSSRNHHIDGSRIFRGRHRPQELFIPRISINTTRAEIADSLREMVNGIDVRESDVVFPRGPAYDSSEQEVESYEHLIRVSCIEARIEPEDFSLHVRKPNPKDFTMIGYLGIQDPSKVNIITRTLEGKGFNDRSIDIEQEFRTSMVIKPDVYKVLRRELDELFHQNGHSISGQKLRNGLFAIRINAKSLEELNILRSRVTEVIGCKIIAIAADKVSYWTMQKGEKFVKGIEKSKNVCIIFDRHRASLHVYGNRKERAVEAINKKIEELATLRIEIIRMTDIPGLIKALLKKFGYDLKKLESKVPNSLVQFNFQRRSLNFQGNDSEFEVLNKEIDNLKKMLAVEVESTVEGPDCCVCFTAPEEQYVLACCGHSYCKDCIRGLMTSYTTDRKFPFKCVKEDCGELFSIADLTQLRGPTLEHFEDIINSAMDHMVTNSNMKYKFCVTPDCNGVYKSTKLGSDTNSAFRCYKCDIILCTTCDTIYHVGLTCHMAKGLETDEDFGFKTYLNRHQGRWAPCKRCGQIIEKTEGCNHMTCRCGAHFCWLCHQVFPSEDGVYGHQRTCPKKPV